jgi:hypothetical protein
MKIKELLKENYRRGDAILIQKATNNKYTRHHVWRVLNGHTLHQSEEIIDAAIALHKQRNQKHNQLIKQFRQAVA